MDLRFYIDPETQEPHIYGHGVSEEEVEEVLTQPYEDWRGRRGARVALGQTDAGRFLQVVYTRDSQQGSLFVITAYDPGPRALQAFRRRHRRRR